MDKSSKEVIKSKGIIVNYLSNLFLEVKYFIGGRTDNTCLRRIMNSIKQMGFSLLGVDTERGECHRGKA